MFIPATLDEARLLGWSGFDVILVSGDAYIDSPNMGIAVIGHVLIDAGYRVGIIAQPDINSESDITRLGEPALFWGISSGCVDSMVSNYNADRRIRLHDDLTPGGVHGKRPDRALIAYTGLIRRYFKNTVPVVLGGIEASLRRIAHYDYWQNSIRRSVLFDAKADVIIYGMGERPVTELAASIAAGRDWRDIRGICYAGMCPEEHKLVLPSYEEAAADSDMFESMFRDFYHETVSENPRTIIQKHGERYLIQNPPAEILTPEELGRVNTLPYERSLHPLCAGKGEVRAVDTARFSITTHRGCFGECSFCAITVHQGKKVVSRSIESICSEARSITGHPDFKGYIDDVGGPTANMYSYTCSSRKHPGSCVKSCLYPGVCSSLQHGHADQIRMLRALKGIEGIKKVFIRSGVRYDLVTADVKMGKDYLTDILQNNISGQMRIAPEHSNGRVLKLMRKPGEVELDEFRRLFKKVQGETGSRIYLSYYYMAAHPGCSIEDMKELKQNAGIVFNELNAHVQIFTPTPSTFSTLAYWTGKDPFTGKALFVEKEMGSKLKQKKILQPGESGNLNRGRRKR